MEGQSDDVKYPEKKLQSPPFASSHEILEKSKMNLWAISEKSFIRLTEKRRSVIFPSGKMTPM